MTHETYASDDEDYETSNIQSGGSSIQPDRTAVKDDINDNEVIKPL